MVLNKLADPEVENQKAYDELLVAIEASEGMLSLLIAVCDDSNYRKQVIERYEAELQQNIPSYQLELPRGEPSLKAAIAELVQRDEYLQNGGKAVLTVIGAEKLYFLKLGAERSEQEIFFGYLQWTREGLREFPYPIVLWVTNQILANLRKKAPDFWSWRKGIFRFLSKKKAAITRQEIVNLPISLDDSELPSTDDDNPYFLPLEDLQELIQQTKQQRGAKDPLLATLYTRMGEIYQRRRERGEYQDYKTEQALAIEYFRKAIELQKELGLEMDLAYSLNNLADLYESQGRYSEAEPLYMQALELRKRLLGEEHADVANSLNHLAGLYEYQGRYSEAEPLYAQALALRKRLLGEEHADVANSLNNLAGLYESQGRYSEAERLYMQALELRKRLLGEEHADVATSLHNLAFLYYVQGRYGEAESLYAQALALREHLFGEEHPDVTASLNNLARVYYAQGRYSEAEPMLVQALALRKRLLGEEHPRTAQSLNNLALLYYAQGRYSEAEPMLVQALALRKRLLGEAHPDVATSLDNLALLYYAQGRYSEAEPIFVQALNICQQRLGVEHPKTVTIRENLEKLQAAMRS